MLCHGWGQYPKAQYRNKDGYPRACRDDSYEVAFAISALSVVDWAKLLGHQPSSVRYDPSVTVGFSNHDFLRGVPVAALSVRENSGPILRSDWRVALTNRRSQWCELSAEKSS